MDYEKAYKKALERAKDYYKANQKIGESEENDMLSDIFPELVENEEEKIRRELISFVNNDGWKFTKLTKEEKESWIAWLEKKPTDKVKPKFNVGDWCMDNEDGTIFQIVKVLDNTYTYKTNEGEEYSCTHYSLENDSRLWTIQDAKDGDILSSKDKLNILIFRNLDTSTSFSSYYNIAGKGELGWSNERFIPATKEQRDTLFAAMKAEGYEWDDKKKEIIHLKDENDLERKSEDEKIRKALMRFIERFPYDRLDNNGVSAKEALTWLEKQVEQKHIDKVEPKFKVGDWLQYRNAKPFFVEEITEQGYVNGESCLPFNWENEIHLWTIEDAKDGDVLCYKDEVFLYKQDIKDWKETSFGGMVYYCCYDGKSFITGSFYSLTEQDKIDIHPSTKEQCELLFTKMHEAGYDWDEDKMELKK